MILMGGLVLVGCATERPATREPERVIVQPEKVIVQVEPSRKDEVLEGRVRALEASVPSLRWDMEKWNAMERSISLLRSEVDSLNDRLSRLPTRLPLASYRLPREVSLCGERVPLEDRNIWENLDREFLVILDNEAQILLWMKRARRYFPYIEKRLEEMGLPDDLKYMTITESSLRP